MPGTNNNYVSFTTHEVRKGELACRLTTIKVTINRRYISNRKVISRGRRPRLIFSDEQLNKLMHSLMNRSVNARLIDRWPRETILQCTRPTQTKRISSMCYNSVVNVFEIAQPHDITCTF